MLNISENFMFILLTVTASLLFMWGLNRIWPWDKRHAHNDLIGWQLSILGTTYAVILGFMLYTVWTNFVVAQLNAENEANAVGNIYRLAEGLPAQQSQQMETLTRSYAKTVVDDDWPQMEAGKLPEGSHNINEEMWRTLMSIKNPSATELMAEDHALSELSALTEHRRIRLLQNVSHLPIVLWCVLIIGGALTVGSASMFGSANTFLHTLQVFVFSLLIALALVAVADIDRPFQGAFHISDYAFRRAEHNMK
jgi:hypothetical protein